MSYIDWDNSLSIGNEDIDGQHKQWINIINKVHGALIGERNSSLESLTIEALKEMEEYMAVHFAKEEEWMRSIGYPKYEQHKEMHTLFHIKVKDWLEKETATGMHLLNSSLMKILKNWLQNHIRQEDKDIQMFVKLMKKKRS